MNYFPQTTDGLHTQYEETLPLKQDNIKIDHRETGYMRMGCTQLAQEIT